MIKYVWDDFVVAFMLLALGEYNAINFDVFLGAFFVFKVCLSVAWIDTGQH